MSYASSSNLALSDEQQLLAENLHRFLLGNNSLEQRRAQLAKAMPDRLALWPSLIDMGLAGAAFPESVGGFGEDARTLAVVMFELGRSLVMEPYLACPVIAGRILLQLSDEAVREDCINRIVSGELIVVLAHDGGADPFAQPKPVARKEAHGFSVDGRIKCVRHADISEEFLVTALLDSSPAVFRVPRAALNIQPYNLMDGTCAADLVLTDLHLPVDAQLSFDVPVTQVLAEALEWGILGLAAEALGIINAANQATFEHLTTRKQFGSTLAAFQALQHRASDMWIAEQELFALLTTAIEVMRSPAGLARSSLLSALRVVSDKSRLRVGHEAIQMHGGMGVSDEVNVSHYARRLASMRTELGSHMLHSMRFGCTQDLSGLLRLQDSREDQEWRTQVTDFTKKFLPPLIAAKGSLGLKIEKDDYVAWQKVLQQQGFFAGAWPREYGGQGWDLVKQLLFTQETALHDGPWISPYGVNMVGPVLYTFGSDAQKRQHLPGILSNDVWWCQGYSEPGAGSDLASLKTSAERSGEHYIVNGSKLWTTEAHWADWMHCLVRTSRDGKPQSGITFLLIDMTSPGISIKPIITIDGMHHTNAVFFDDVRVPVSNRVGEEGEGWRIAKFLLSNERVSIGDTGQKLRLLRHVQARYKTVLAEDQLPNDIKALLSHRLSEVSIQLLTLCAMERQFINAWASGRPFGVEASIIKIRSTEILQAMTELALELEGSLGAAYDPKDLLRSPSFERNDAQRASSVGYEYLYGRCWTIFGGTSEVQRNIIAKGILAPTTAS